MCRLSAPPLHGFYRMPGRWLAGPFAQYEQLTRHATPQITANQSYVGAEAQYYGANYSLYAQLAYQHFSGGSVAIDGAAAGLRARYFFSPDWLGEATVGYASAPANTSLSSVTWGLATEYRLADGPVSVYLSYAHDRTSYQFVLDRDRVTVGMKLNLDSRSLWDRETGGASLSPIIAGSPPVLY